VGGGEGIDHEFRADIELDHGQVISGSDWQLEAIHTPGHLSDHMCFANGKRLFSGDHVMGWATSMISPPEGNLTAFMMSLQILQSRSETLYFPGHGAPIEDGPMIVDHLFKHRKSREAQILSALNVGPNDMSGLTSEIYANVDPSLHRAASRNVLSHLIDLYGRGLITCPGAFSKDAIFKIAQK